MRLSLQRARIGCLALTAGAGSALAAEPDLWLHVKVDERGGAKVTVNLPLALAEKAMAMIPEDEMRHGRLQLDEGEWTVEELRARWAEVAVAPDVTFVTVEDDDQNVRVWKEAGYLRVQAREAGDGETVDVRAPAPVVEALLSGEGEELNVGAAVEALAAHGEGEIVAVSDDRERVRVWVDRVAESP